MKRFLSMTVCAAIMLSLTACGSENGSGSTGGDSNTSSSISSQAPTSSESGENINVSEKGEETSVQEQKLPEGATELKLMDGNKATEEEIAKCEKLTDSDSYMYTVNTVFAYPSGTTNNDKKIGNNSSVNKLSEGSKWGDLTVSKAEAAYHDDYNGINAERIACQYLWLKGNLSFKCKAYYSTAANADNQIVLELPEEISKQLPSLSPYTTWDEEGYTDDCVTFLLYPESNELGEKIAERLETSDEAEVTVSADEIKIQYTYFGLMTDGGTWGSLENVTDFEIK